MITTPSLSFTYLKVCVTVLEVSLQLVQIIILLLLQPVQPQLEHQFHQQARHAYPHHDGRYGDLDAGGPVVRSELSQSEPIWALAVAVRTLTEVQEASWVGVSGFVVP